MNVYVVLPAGIKQNKTKQTGIELAFIPSILVAHMKMMMKMKMKMKMMRRKRMMRRLMTMKRAV